jgi:two-component system response regulator PilR (NtrC family)
MSTPARILVVDDERSMREFLRIMLARQGHEVTCASGGQEGIDLLTQRVFDLALVDLRMPEVDGLSVLREAKRLSLPTEIVVITAYATTQTALEAMKLGAYDYLTKPFKLDEIAVVIEKALEKAALLRENRELKRQLGQPIVDGLVGKSPKMMEVFDLITKVAPTKSNILITGESGTGKELVARAIHFHSPRRSGPFVALHCAALPETLLESELFGHEKGAFTDAHRRRTGSFEEASGGTLFLDEVAEIPPQIQVKLLRVLQERSLRRLGGNEEIHVDVRIVAATNRDLQEAVQAGVFREDLFYRLNVIQIRLPPLRERLDDIPLLCQHFLTKYSGVLHKQFRGISKPVIDLLLSYPWPGNVRELENVIERAVTLESGQEIGVGALPPSMREVHSAPIWPENLKLPEEGVDLDQLLDRVEKTLLTQALRRAGGVRTEAAKLLGITFRSMRYRMRKHLLADGD